MRQIGKLLDVAAQRRNSALRGWLQLNMECADAIRKLSLLKEYRDRCRNRMDARLRAGMVATATVGYVDFIGQVDDVVVRQEDALQALEVACETQWQEFLDARRERRAYEILGEQIKAREAHAALRRQQHEIDELIQRAVAIEKNIDENRNYRK